MGCTRNHADGADDGVVDDPRVVRTRQAVHAAGLKLLVESGPAAVTHVAVAAATTLSRTTLYKHWPTRVDLLVEVCHSGESPMAIDPGGDIRADLVQLAAAVAGTLADPESRKLFASLLVTSQWDGDDRELRSAMIARGVADLELVLESGVAAGDLPAGIDPAHAAGRLFGPLLFTALVTDVEIGPSEVESIVDDWLATVRA